MKIAIWFLRWREGRSKQANRFRCAVLRLFGRSRRLAPARGRLRHSLYGKAPCTAGSRSSGERDVLRSHLQPQPKADPPQVEANVKTLALAGANVPLCPKNQLHVDKTACDRMLSAQKHKARAVCRSGRRWEPLKAGMRGPLAAILTFSRPCPKSDFLSLGGGFLMESNDHKLSIFQLWSGF